MNERIFYQEMPSPLGKLTLLGIANALSHVHMEGGDFSVPASARRGAAVLGDARRQLEEYFAGKRTKFELPMAARGTPFQCRVWFHLAQIPFAETRSYADVARALSNPRAFRAVGLANGANPIAIIVPCHRVIGADGGLTGFGGGLQRKRWLLDHEQSVAKRMARANVA